MIQSQRRFESVIATTAAVIANLSQAFLDRVFGDPNDKSLLMIPVRTGRRGGSPVAYRLSAKRRNCPSLRPWPLCLIVRD